MSLNAALTRTIDWFIPAERLDDREMRTRARMFLLSHLFGPIISYVIPVYLLWADPGSARTLVVLGRLDRRLLDLPLSCQIHEAL